ncbi:MAG TPA: hypothetical protein VFT29_17360 [Gemmatimonadaceae bacterium]|nr:hypothetical protein [Gemmatimonadaceae bacterium]
MRMHAAAGLVVLAVVISSCASEQPSAPLTRVSSSAFARGGAGGGGSDPCSDPKKEECILTGRFTGGGGQIVAIGDVYVTRGFTLHCDVLLSNNLEINWPGNKWHTDKPFTVVTCLDDPGYAPEPPDAPVDTYIGDGLGTLNGVPGYRAVIRFEDHGERPSSEPDRASIQVIAPDNTVVLNVPLQDLTNGNIQAHFDQPHK